MEKLAIPTMPGSDAVISSVFHVSVLPEETLEHLSIQGNDTVVDATLGGAGHFSLMLKRLAEDGILIGIDADQDAIERAKLAVTADERTSGRPTVHLVEDNFRNLDAILSGLGINTIDKALFDLGWSGFQLGGGKGFSFQADEPLIMQYGKAEAGKTAADLVNSLPENELADLIYEFGEESRARVIAKAIVVARRESRILTTGALANIIAEAMHFKGGKIHPATKTFQALRIAANDEFGALADGLAAAWKRLTPGGRMAVISFHSSEDRIVKQFMKARQSEGAIAVTKKPIAPGRAEQVANRRSRSAKLRVIEKTSESIYE